jgi:integrase
MEGVDEMRGGVYHHRSGWRVRFKGQWFFKDEFGRPFKAEFYAQAFLNHLNSLYDPDPGKNRYDPLKFKDRTPHRFDQAFSLYLDRVQNDSSWHKSKYWIWKKYFRPFFKDQDFRTIDQVQLEGLQTWLEKKELKGKTIKNIMMTLHGFLFHFRSSIPGSLPVFPKISYQQPKIKWFTEKEIDQVFEFLKEEDKGYFWAIRGYGLRPEEASGLLKSALSLETKEVMISTVYVDGRMKPRTKTRRERAIPIEICPEVISYFIKDSDSVFVFSVAGRPYSRHMREDRWRKAMKQAHEKYGTRMMTLRDLRHSAGTMWRQKQVPLDIIRKLLGHSSQEVTDRFYAEADLHQVVGMVRK